MTKITFGTNGQISAELVTDANGPMIYLCVEDRALAEFTIHEWEQVAAAVSKLAAAGAVARAAHARARSKSKHR